MKELIILIVLFIVAIKVVDIVKAHRRNKKEQERMKDAFKDALNEHEQEKES